LTCASRALASLWRGADLATISKGEGVGASLQSDEGDILLEDDLMLCEEALNEQASKPCIDYLFGTTRCLAYLKLTRPQRKNIDQDLKVDEFLLKSGVPQAVKDVAERYERRSVLLSSNLVFSKWDQIFKDPMTTMAAIDRLVHHAIILEFQRREHASATRKRKGRRLTRRAGQPLRLRRRGWPRGLETTKATMKQ